MYEYFLIIINVKHALALSLSQFITLYSTNNNYNNKNNSLILVLTI